MSCIPKINWISQQQKTHLFNRFRLVTTNVEQHKIEGQLRCLPIDENAENILFLTIDDVKIQNKESYQIEIGCGFIRVTAQSHCALYSALATIKLSLTTQNSELNLGVISDTPAFENRGIMIDVSRGKMPTLSYLKSLVGVMSDLKYNILQLYCEDKLALQNHPKIGEMTGVYTESQIRELDCYCAEHFVELQPCIQTYSHMHGILRTPGYTHLAENDSLFSLAAGNEAVYALLDDMFAQTLPWFSCKTLNINMDEAYDIGTGFSKDAVERLGKGEVFIAHINRVIELARRHGAEKILLWGDITNKYPQLRSKLPDNTVIIDWNYNAQHTFPSLDIFAQSDAEFWAAGGVSTWNSIFPRVYNSYINLIAYSKAACERSAQGFLVTDWGDYGHMQPLGLSLYGYMIGAQQAYQPTVCDDKEIEKQAWPLIFCDENMQQAFRLLMDSNLAENLQTGFKTMSIYYFFDDMLKGLALCGNDKYPPLTEKTFTMLYACGEKAYALLSQTLRDAQYSQKVFADQNWQSLFGKSFVQELLLSARMTRFIGKKGKASFQIRQIMQSPRICVDDILMLINSVRDLYQELCQIRREFEDVWLLRAEPQGIETSLSLFDRAGVRLYETTKWLAKQLHLLQQGHDVDALLSTYVLPNDFGLLWTADFQNMWDRAYPWQ